MIHLPSHGQPEVLDGYPLNFKSKISFPDKPGKPQTVHPFIKVGFWSVAGSDTERVSLTAGVKTTNKNFFEILRSIGGGGGTGMLFDGPLQKVGKKQKKNDPTQPEPTQPLILLTFLSVRFKKKRKKGSSK